MKLWLLFFVIGVGTFALRYSFIFLFGKIEIPEVVERALRFVPPTVLMGIILPAVLKSNGSLEVSVSNERIWAALVAFGVAYWTKSVLLTLILGMTALILIQMVI
jgi:branched-subunit amino acid transport protein